MRTFEQSVAECRILGGSLAAINSNFEQDAITAMMSGQHLPVWIGLRMRDHQHAWIQNTPIIYTNWVDNEPLWHNKNLTRRTSNLTDDVSAACNSLHAGAVPAVPHSAGDVAFMRYLAAANYSTNTATADKTTFWIGLKLNTTELILRSDDNREMGAPVYLDYAALFEEMARAGNSENLCFALVSGKPVYEAKPCNHTGPAICSYLLGECIILLSFILWHVLFSDVVWEATI
ncbi:unnamed protein product [Dibothriocephalus latus]|uniref:C-type lectin domain-containing protein n=1 Tax=Dibothriocephalus latus TaxID=60516 RepID=A0A3P7LC62_DIBLA|nr:unnamed protein product [Dibothriocephalus latus]